MSAPHPGPHAPTHSPPAGGRLRQQTGGLLSQVHHFALVAVLVAAGALAGCDTAVDSPASLFGTYTLWGALDPTADVQLVRVVAVTDTLLPTRPDPLPVTLASVDLATGVETSWRDSLVTFRNGSVGHIYSARFRPTYGGRYRIVLRRDADGGETTAALTVPPATVPVVQPTSLVDGVRVPVLWPGAPQLNRVRVSYLVQDRSCETEELTVDLTESSGTSGAVAGGWAVVLNLSRVASALRTLTRFKEPGQPLPDLGLLRVTVRGQVAGLEWRPPGGVFDFEAFAVPEVFGNVAGGFGFVGGAYRSEASFRPDPRDLSRTTFVDTSSCPG